MLYAETYVLSFWMARVLEFLGIISYEVVDEVLLGGHKESSGSIPHPDSQLPGCSSVGEQPRMRSRDEGGQLKEAALD